MDLNGPFNFFRYRRMAETRREMIDHHSQFLTMALRGDAETPKIPRRRVDQGGYSELMKRPGARAAALAWWDSVLKPATSDAR